MHQTIESYEVKHIEWCKIQTEYTRNTVWVHLQCSTMLWVSPNATKEIKEQQRNQSITGEVLCKLF